VNVLMIKMIICNLTSSLLTRGYESDGTNLIGSEQDDVGVTPRMYRRSVRYLSVHVNHPVESVDDSYPYESSRP